MQGLIGKTHYGLMRRAYGPTHYEMGCTTMTLAFKTNQAN
jgi:hypothetical protein